MKGFTNILLKIGLIFTIWLYVTHCGVQRASNDKIYAMDFHYFADKKVTGEQGEYNTFVIIFKISRPLTI